MVVTKEQFLAEWALLRDKSEIYREASYTEWRNVILGDSAMSGYLEAATGHFNAGYISYYAYLRLYYYLAEKDPDYAVADKYAGEHSDTPTGKANWGVLALVGGGLFLLSKAVKKK